MRFHDLAIKRALRFTFIAVFGVFSALAEEGSVPAPRVTITSQPAGATVIIDGRDRGVTPITLFDLEKGRHHLKYRLAGYEERDRFFNTEEGPLLEKNEVLSEVKGLLLLVSEPEGATIEIDGNAVGTAPRFIGGLSVKDPHTVRFIKTGYQSQAVSVKFNGREPMVKKVTLLRDAGGISVRTDPEGASVTVNGVDRGLSPLELEDVPKGRATVQLKKDGFRLEKRELSIRAGDHQTLSVALEPLPGTLYLISDPEGARFYLDDEARGTGPVTISGLKPGEYTVRVEKQGYAVESRKVKIDNGKSLREEFKLANIMGRLEIQTNPAGGTVVLDGRILGITKEVSGDSLSAVFAVEDLMEGEHSLVVRKDGFKEVSRKVKIGNSKTSHHKVTLKRLFVPNVRIDTVRGVSKTGVLISNSGESVVLETSPGINSTIPKDEIRKISFLEEAK